MSFNYTCNALQEQFSDPIYPVLLEIRINNIIKSDVVIYTHDRLLGTFDFGNLKDTVEYLPPAYVNTIKNSIRECIGN